MVLSDGFEQFYALEIPAASLYEGATIYVTGILVDLNDVDSATIEFVLDGQHAISDELLLEP